MQARVAFRSVSGGSRASGAARWHVLAGHGGQAARRAIENARIDQAEIDLLLTHTAVPDYLLSNTACVLHRRLGLAPGCFTMQAEASGYSFMM